MTNPIHGVGKGPTMPPSRQGNMTEGQKVSFREIISKYDNKNFTKADFELMGKELRQAGIRPSNEVKSMLETSGFNVEQHIKSGPEGMEGARPKGGPGGMGKPIDMQEGLQQLLNISKETGDTDLKAIIEVMLSKSEKGSVTEDDQQKLTSYLQKNVPLIGFFMDSSM